MQSQSIAVLLSGGVDSSIALHLLQQQGHRIQAFYLKVWMEEDTPFGDCPWQEDVRYVEKVCSQLNVPFEIVPMQREYWDRVVAYTLAEVSVGRTPNPDMMCNQLVKFGAFDEKYGKEFDRIASGHYARTRLDETGRVHLLTSQDNKKDQTYFLSQMRREQLARALFPIGDLTKAQVRERAAALHLATSDRPDSQGICFLGKINYRDFLARHVGRKKGKIVERSTGNILGDHDGFWFYTIGQRFGLRLAGGPWFVVDKEGESNTVFVAHGRDPEEVYCDRIDVTAFNWINPLIAAQQPNSVPIRFKIRHAPEFFTGRVELQGNDSLTIYPDAKIAGVAKGQFAVLYQDQECLGGGVIS